MVSKTYAVYTKELGYWAIRSRYPEGMKEAALNEAEHWANHGDSARVVEETNTVIYEP